MKIVTSLQNQLIKQIASLHTSKGRSMEGLFLAEGLRTITTILDSGLTLHSLFCTEKTAALAQSLAPEEEIVLVADNIMPKISTTVTPAELLAVFAIPQPQLPLTTGVVLAQIADPGNMGTLIRTTAAMGYQTVVIVEGSDPWSPKVVQASAGTIAQLKVFRLSWPQLLAQKKQLALCALVVKSGEPPHKLDLANSLIVVGNEAHGLPTNWVADCTQKMTLSMPGGTESLNAAVAGSIALYLTKI